MARPRKDPKATALKGTYRGRAGHDGQLPHSPRLGEPEPLCKLSYSAAHAAIRYAASYGLKARDGLYVSVAAQLLMHLSTVGIAKIEPPKLNRLEIMLRTLGLTPVDARKLLDMPAPEPNEFDEDERLHPDAYLKPPKK